MYVLYYDSGLASIFPHMLLRELGAPFELRRVDRAGQEHASPDYLRLNPNGRIPVLLDGETAIYETAAIALHLVDRHPEAGLAPAPGTLERGHYYKWMLHLANTTQAEFRAWFYPHEFTTDPAHVDSVKAAAGQRLMTNFGLIAQQLGQGPWLLGDQFSAVDLYLWMMVRWGRTLPTPIREIPELGAHAARVLARPAVQEALRVEELQAPFV
jgi:glutathione S-transferase